MSGVRTAWPPQCVLVKTGWPQRGGASPSQGMGHRLTGHDVSPLDTLCLMYARETMRHSRTKPLPWCVYSVALT